MIRRRASQVILPEDAQPRVPWRGMTAAWAVLAVVYLVSWIQRGDFPLDPEEAQYWDWSRRLDWCYCTKPPLIAYFIRMFTGVFGNTLFAVRAAALTLSTGMGVITYVLVMRLHQSPRIAFFTLLTLFLMPLYSVGAVVATTDTPLLFFWSACCLCLSVALLGKNQSFSPGDPGPGERPERPGAWKERRWAWPVAGVCFGLGHHAVGIQHTGGPRTG